MNVSSDSVVKKGVRSKLSEAVEALAGVEEQLYVSLDGILGRNVKRVQDGLKRVKEAMETEDRSNTKGNFSTWTRRGSGVGVYFVVFVCVCVCVCVCACVCVCVCADASGFLVPFPLHTPQSLTRHTLSTGAVEYVLPTNRPPLIK